MGGPSSDFHALYQQRRMHEMMNGIRDLTETPTLDFMRDLYNEPSIQQTNLMPVATATSFDEAIRNAMALAEKEITAIAEGARTPPIPAQLLPKDLLPALRKAETPKEAAQREVHDFIEQATGRNRTPLPPQFQSAIVTVPSMVNPFQMRKF